MEITEVKSAVQEVIAPVAVQVKEVKTAVEAAKTASETAVQKAETVEGEVKKVNDEVKGLNEWKVKKDEADQKNQEALDKLILDSQKKNVRVGTEQKHFRDLLAESIEEQKDNIAKFASKQARDVTFQMKAVGDMTLNSPTTFPTADVSITTLRPGIIEMPKRRLHIRQLLSGGAMSGSHYSFVKEIAGEGNPAPVAEGALKPRMDLRLVEESTPAQTIAAILKISRKMLNDVPGLITLLQSRLPEKLLRVEDEQILNGNGTTPNLSGITNAGNYTPVVYDEPTTVWLEQIVAGITQAEEADKDVNGILLRPKYYTKLLLNRAAGGAGTYDLPRELVTYTNGQLYIAGVPVFKSTAANQDEFIVGDWVMGANLIVKEPPIIQFFEQDEDNVQKNMVTVRIEETIALPIYGNDYFFVGEFEPQTT